MSDQDIIQRYIAGRATEHQTIHKWIEEVVRSRAWVIRTWIDDIISDTTEKLLLLFRNDRFQHNSSLKTYVQQITRYTIVDYLRRDILWKKYREELQRAAPDLENPSQSHDEREQYEIISRIFSMLDVGCQKLWALVFTEGLRYKEIAEKLGISPDAAKTRAHRCIEKAREFAKKFC